MREEIGGLDLLQGELDLLGLVGSLGLSLGGDDLSVLSGLGLLEVVLSDSL